VTPKTALFSSPVLYYLRIWRLWRILFFYCFDLQCEQEECQDEARLQAIQSRLDRWSSLRDKVWAVRQKKLQELNEDLKYLPN
jgi:hypothetical protein